MEHIPHNVKVVRRGESRPPAVDSMSRRQFGAGVVANVVLGGAGAKLLVDHERAEASKREEQNAVIEDLVKEAVMEGNSNSKYFDSSVAEAVKIMRPDGDLAIEHIDLINTILEYGEMPGIDNEIVRDRLERMLPAIAFTESRFDVEAFNEESGSFGPFQLKPETWEELAEEGQNIESIEDQIKVTARLLEQCYQHITTTCSAELELIKERFFNGDDAAFQEYFVLAAAINGIFSGMGTMVDVIQNFVEDYTTPEDLRGLSTKGEYLTDRDVFTGMSHAAHGLQWNKNYGDESAKYTYKPYAAYQVITAALDDFVTKPKA